MKKIAFIFVGLFIVSVLFTSCKKDYTCKCTVNGVSFHIPLIKPLNLTQKANATPTFRVQPFANLINIRQI